VLSNLFCLNNRVNLLKTLSKQSKIIKKTFKILRNDLKKPSKIEVIERYSNIITQNIQFKKKLEKLKRKSLNNRKNEFIF
jgi:hypothetical protein